MIASFPVLFYQPPMAHTPMARYLRISNNSSNSRRQLCATEITVGV